MVEEAKKHKHTYSRFQGGQKAMKAVSKALEVASKEESIHSNKWLSKLGHGQIVVETYKQPICFLSRKDSCTFFLLRVGPSGKIDPFYLLHVSGNHWVLANVQGRDGIKLIAPPIMENRMTSRISKLWLLHIQKGCALYSKGITLSN
jgi:hypothetical protein